MGKQAHTSGPWADKGTDCEDWSVDYDGDCSWCFVGPKSRTPVAICVAKGYYAEQRLYANARLISAAPDMLEALQQLIIEYDEVDLAEAEPASFTAAVIAARAATAKATGDAP